MTDFQKIHDNVMEKLTCIKNETDKNDPYARMIDIINEVAVNATIATLKEYEKSKH